MKETLITLILSLLDKIKEAIIWLLSFMGNLLHELTVLFNNRELAIGFWLIVFIIFALFIKGVREKLQDIVKILLCKQIVLWFLSMAAYYLVLIFILAQIGFWDISLIKETVLWFIIVGISSSLKAVG